MRSLIILSILNLFGCSTDEPNVSTQTQHVLQDGQKEAYFADACYWCTEGIWECLEGVISVESGFVGGTTPAVPTYARHGNFAEGNRIVYDPSVITYSALVDAYFDGHSFGGSPDKGQSYRAVAFYSGDDQKSILDARHDEAILSRPTAFQQDISPIEDANWFIGPKDHQDYVSRLEAGERVPNPSYGVNESIPRRNAALRVITAPNNCGY